jgi:hypothetical protein
MQQLRFTPSLQLVMRLDVKMHAAQQKQHLKALLCLGVWWCLQPRIVDQAVQRQPARLEGINKGADGPAASRKDTMRLRTRVYAA